MAADRRRQIDQEGGSVMTLRYVVLGLLSEEASHGYRLKRRIEDRVGSIWQVNVGQVYQTLAQLNRQGLTRSKMEPTEQFKMRRVYEITDKGRRALATWLKRRPGMPGPVRPEIIVRLLGLESGKYQIAIQQLRAEEEVYLKYLEGLKGNQGEVGRVEVTGAKSSFRVSEIALDIARRQAQAHLDWLKACRERVEHLSSSCISPVEAPRTPALSAAAD